MQIVPYIQAISGAIGLITLRGRDDRQTRVVKWLKWRGYVAEVLMQLSGTVSDERGTFHTRVMAREVNDGRWEGWLEFVPSDARGRSYATPIETRQHDRATLERWASGLTDVYADGALARAQALRTVSADDEVLLALQELVEALDRRVPHLERAGEATIADEARLLRVEATERIALLQNRGSGRT